MWINLFSFLKNKLELFFWIGGLIFLIFISPDTTHFSICPLKLSGISWCPGCGLGKSISYLLQFKLYESFNTHPLGIFALLVLSTRIYQLIKNIRREQNG